MALAKPWMPSLRADSTELWGTAEATRRSQQDLCTVKPYKAFVSRLMGHKSPMLAERPALGRADELHKGMRLPRTPRGGNLEVCPPLPPWGPPALQWDLP